MVYMKTLNFTEVLPENRRYLLSQKNRFYGKVDSWTKLRRMQRLQLSGPEKSEHTG